MLTCKEEPNQETFMFFSYIQKSKKDKRKTHSCNKEGVIEISDDEEDNDDVSTDLELLYEVEFEAAKALPMPIEQKLVCKTESTNLPHSPQCQKQAQLSECEDELLPLCKLEPDCDLRNENMLYAQNVGNNYILYVCPQCGVTFDGNSQWREHIASEHNFHIQQNLNFVRKPNNEFKCKTCAVVITRCTLKTLQQHFFTHLLYKVYKCKLCRHESRSLYIMISHIMLHRDKEELGVAILTPAKQKTTSAVTLKNVALEQESRQLIAYVCPACGENFNAEDDWQAHINFRHNFLEKTAENRFEDHFKCKDCGVEIFSQHVSDLQQHLFTHLPFKSFLKCKLCDWTISRRNFMLSHILNLHKNHLSTSAAEAVDGIGLKTIVETFHYDSDDNDSNIANNALVQKPTADNWTTIQQVELEEDNNTQPTASRKTISPRDFSCKNCKRLFKTAAERNSHIVAEHPKYKCVKCAETFALKVDYKRHYCEKLTNMSMQCSVCFKEYNYEKCYRNHIRHCLPQTARNNAMF